MLSYTANQAKTHFGEFLDQVQREPVQVLKRDRVVGVMVSAQDYEAMRNFYANRLQGTLAQNAASAAAQGLTEDELQRLLADES
ncbi:type II toxin-antitoxin system Phd/YefM family antitoxin [Hydrogenophaga taeniospiralis]|jgi:prevent-host-death family protein|uniref:type II toxin-antitoxin system Phd/YefM family antitoxin n=1 Tax=Hydrogenophaga taeniospiralis TaxID=65656 RepID=UPI001CFB6667|nr:type II toxin-antitoxin system Phd/YefM family antitoxin [Hydrogenophaga taeniospiralis]MCB4364549.1 type II toxin-antitoxin system Phd/YefM family antitoxin [Hydrogenophaga taeniospiralis]